MRIAIFVVALISATAWAQSVENTNKPTTSPTTTPSEIIPLPAKTAFDRDTYLRDVYLAYYEQGYQAGISGKVTMHCTWLGDAAKAESEGHSDGQTAGLDARYKKLLEAEAKGIPFTEPAIPPTTIVPVKPKKSDADIRRELDRRLPFLRSKGISFNDIVDFLRDITGFDIDVDPAVAERNKNAAVTFDLKDTNASAGLDAILKSVDSKGTVLAWDVRDGRIVIFAKSPSSQPVQVQEKEEEKGSD